MKKLIALLLAALMVLSFAACAGTKDSPTPNCDYDETTKAPVDDDEDSTDAATEPPTQESEDMPTQEPTDAPTEEPTPEQAGSGLRPEFKDAMEHYEAFYDEYCDFMAQYMANPYDPTLLAEYADMLAELAEMDSAFEAWGDSDLNDEELAYYLEVQTRVLQKLSSVLQ